MGIIMRIKDIAIIGMMSAIMIAVQVVLGFIPNIELVSLLVILYTLVFGWNALYIIYVFVAVEGLIYGIGPWWINYLYIWTVLFIIAMLLRRMKTTLLWAVISGAFGLSFGALCSIPYFITGGINSGFAYWVQGIPFDLAHCAGNFIAALVLFRPLYLILDKINRQTAHN
jgi:energy-coupling factor transport system substrate-specific component